MAALPAPRKACLSYNHIGGIERPVAHGIFMARPDPVSKPPRFSMVVTIAVIVTALYFAQDVLIPLALATLLSFLLAPLSYRLERKGLPRVPAVIAVVILSCSLLVGLGWVM